MTPLDATVTQAVRELGAALVASREHQRAYVSDLRAFGSQVAEQRHEARRAACADRVRRARRDLDEALLGGLS